MAITTSSFKVNAGWATTDVITQMEQAMTSLDGRVVRLVDMLLVLEQ